MLILEYLIPGLLFTAASFVYVYSVIRIRPRMRSRDYRTADANTWYQRNSGNLVVMEVFWILTLTAPFLSLYLLMLLFAPLDLAESAPDTLVGFVLVLIIGVLSPFRFRVIDAEAENNLASNDTD
jgi:hypothetical protein